MTSPKEILAALLPPMRYASRGGFSHVHTLKGFEELVSDITGRGKAVGLPGEVAAELQACVAGFENMGAAQRQQAVVSVLKLLVPLVDFPDDLKPVLEGAPPAVATSQPTLPFALTSERSSPVPPPDAQEEPPRSPKVSKAKTAKPKATKAKAGPRLVKVVDNASAEPEEPYSSSAPRLPTLHISSGPLATPLKSVSRIHPRLQAQLTRKAIAHAGDVLFLMPRTYEDRRHLGTLAELQPGIRGTALAEIRSVEESFGRRRTLRVVFGDRTGLLVGVYFHFGPWLKAKLPVGKRVVVSGELRAGSHGREMAHPEVEPADDVVEGSTISSSVHFERIVPIYPGFERGEQRTYRDLSYKVVSRFAPSLEDPLPLDVRQRAGLPPLSQSLEEIHFPGPSSDLGKLQSWSSPYHRRLAFDELFFLQLGLALRRQGVKIEPGIRFDASPEIINKALARLPFKLTGAQRRALDDVALDMSRPEPMNRLLQGDVGSGKTAVALCASLIAIQNGYQAAVMAPTEILAEQHARSLSKMVEGSGVVVAAFTAAGGAKARRTNRERLAAGQIHLAVGTHALLEDEVLFPKLGLVVIDEQHRFGVMQRAILRSKGQRPDVLVMTATPIPRTLAMAAYGDLDLSVIDELPPGRTPVKTQVFDTRRREQVYARVRAQLEEGRQAYVIYPLVEESEKVDLLNATTGAEEIAAAFPGRRVGLLHGRMKAEEKEQVMGAFREAQLDILVATTVVEVGVDVPNATVMVVESAERFGLSQLHQLRGRVGRSHHASSCFLIAGYAQSEIARERLAIMEEAADGFAIAQKDLELRGPGEFLGTRQSGLPELAVANLARDQDLLAIARREALAIAEADPRLTSLAHASLARALEERWEGKLALARIG